MTAWSWLCQRARWFRRRQGLAPADPERGERAAVLATELRLLSKRLTTVASDLAAIHGVERRAEETRDR